MSELYRLMRRLVNLMFLHVFLLQEYNDSNDKSIYQQYNIDDETEISEIVLLPSSFIPAPTSRTAANARGLRNTCSARYLFCTTLPLAPGFRMKIGCFSSKKAPKIAFFLHFGAKTICAKASDPDLTQTRKNSGNRRRPSKTISGGPVSLSLRASAHTGVAIRFFPLLRILRRMILLRRNPRADQVSQDRRCLVLGRCSGVGVGGQGEARAAMAQHGGDGFHVHAVL